MAFQFWTLYKCFPTFCTDMDSWTMSMKMFTHCCIVTKHFTATLIWKDSKIERYFNCLSTQTYVVLASRTLKATVHCWFTNINFSIAAKQKWTPFDKSMKFTKHYGFHFPSKNTHTYPPTDTWLLYFFLSMHTQVQLSRPKPLESGCPAIIQAIIIISRHAS